MLYGFNLFNKSKKRKLHIAKKNDEVLTDS